MTIFDQFLAQLDSLEPDSPDWNELDSFITALRTLHESKRQRSAGWRRAQLEERISRFYENNADLIEAMGYTPMRLWSFAETPAEALQERADKVEAFLQILAEYIEKARDLEQLDPPERLRSLKSMALLSDTIASQFDTIDTLLNAGSTAEEPAPAQEVTVSTPPAEPQPPVERMGQTETISTSEPAASTPVEILIEVQPAVEPVTETTVEAPTTKAHAVEAPVELQPVEEPQPEVPAEMRSSATEPVQETAQVESGEADEAVEPEEPAVEQPQVAVPDFIIPPIFENIEDEEDYIPEPMEPLPPAPVKPVPAPAPTSSASTVLTRSAAPARPNTHRVIDEAQPDEEILRLLETHTAAVDSEQMQADLVDFVAKDYLTEAYWLGFILETIGETDGPVFSSLMLKALYTSEWLRAIWPEPADDLLLDLDALLINAPLPEQLSQTDQWLSLAGVLLPALQGTQLSFSPRVSLPGEALPALRQLATGVQNFCTSSHIPNLLSQLRTYLHSTAGLLEAQKKALSWLVVGPTRVTNHAPANAVWFQLSSASEPIGKAVAMVANGLPANQISVNHVDPNDWKQTSKRIMIQQLIEDQQDMLKLWAEPDLVEEEIQERNRTISTERHFKTKPILNPALGNLLDYVDEASQIVRQWATCAETILRFQDDLWDLDELLEWMRRMQKHVEAAAEELSAVQAQEADPARKAALACLRRAVHQLREPFGMNASEPPEELAFADFLQPGARIPEKISVQNQLNIVPICFPEVQLEPTGEPVMEENNLVLLASLLIKEPHRPVRLAVRGWCAKQDYRFINDLIEHPALDEEERKDLVSVSRASYNSGLRRLKRTLDSGKEAIERAMLDDLISEEVRGRYIGMYQEFESKIAAAERMLLQGKFAERIALIQSDIEAYILDPIQERRAADLAEYSNKWPAKREGLENLMKLGRLSEDNYLDVVRMMEDSLQNRVVRRVRDISMSITRFLDGQGDLSDVLVRQEPLSKALDNFMAYRPAISRRKFKDFLDNFQDVRLDDGRGFVKILDEKKRVSCLAGFQAWMDLYDFDEDQGQMQKNVETLMSFLGFEPIGAIISTTTELSASLKINVTSWRMTVRPHQVVHIPQVSSAVQPAWTYQIISIWENLGANITNILRNLKSKTPYILLYHGALTENQMSSIRQMALRHDLHALVLDETMVAYLGFEVNERLQAFFECTLPYTSINPFMGRKGDIRHEMFFGRKSERARLEDPNGPASIYGGRWIGKTALLHEIVYQNQHPEKKSFAVLTDLLSINSNGQYRRSFWNKFAEELERQRVITLPQNKNIPYKTLLDMLYKEIDSRGLRVLAMFDEADQFLSNDAGNDFEVVLSLLELSVRTSWSFKAIFSGVHDVQGFNWIPNQPLAQLGTAVELGPLDPASASALLREPLHALGYRFDTTGREADALPLYALSYTNYHPALIQSFGRWLVDHMRQRSDPFPCYITRQDIEAVACKPEVRDEIRDRFNATLKLDYKYYCITLYMILDQWDKDKGFQQSYSANDIHKAMQTVWPVGFESVDQSAVGLLLKEMRGLGILSVNSRGDYYLRSPNVIGLIGNYSQFEADLATIRSMEPLSPARVKSCHQSFSSSEAEYSPLTNEQMTLLFQSHSGVGIVLGSDALGIDHIGMVVGDMASPAITISEKAAVWDEVSITARSGSALKDWLQDYIARNRNAANIYVFRRLEGSPDEMCQQLEAAHAICRTHSSPAVRVIFAMNAFSTWDWHQLPIETRREYEENKAGAVLWLKHWNLVALQQRLERAHPDNNIKKEWAEKILEVTGGWHMLVEDFFEEYMRTTPVTTRNILDMIEQHGNSLLERTSERRERFLGALGLFDQKLRFVTERFLTERGGVPAEEWPSLLFDAGAEQDQAVLGKEVCETAVRIAEYLEQMGVLERRIDPTHNQPILTVNAVVARLW